MARGGENHGSISCFTCQNRDRTEWCALSPDELKRFDRAKTVRDFAPGEPIYHQGDPSHGVYCIESGLVGLRKIGADGSSTLLGLGFPTNTLGYRALLAGEEHLAGAEALKPTTLCFIEAGTVRDLLDHNPALGVQFLERAARELGEAEEKYYQSVTLNVRQRLIHLLLILRERYGSGQRNGGVTLELPLARQDIAAMIGTRPETLARTLKKMEEDGVAKFKGRRVDIPDAGKLLGEIEGDAWL